MDNIMKCPLCGNSDVHLVTDLFESLDKGLPLPFGVSRFKLSTPRSKYDLYCVSCRKQVTPTFRRDDERHEAARKYREQFDFTSAISVYEIILDKTSIDTEAYWFLALSRQGIAGGHSEDDPLTFCSAPDEHYLQEDENYLRALEEADIDQRQEMKEKAQMLDKIRDEYLEFKKGNPCQVYLCGDLESSDPSVANAVNNIISLLKKEDISFEVSKESPALCCFARNSAKVMVAVGMLDNTDKREKLLFEKRAAEDSDCRVINVTSSAGKIAAGVSNHDIWEDAYDAATPQKVLDRIRQIYPKQVVNNTTTVVVGGDNIKESIQHAYDCFMQKDFKSAKASAEKALQGGAKSVPCDFIKAYFHSYVENTANRNAMELFFKQHHPTLNAEDLLRMKNLFLISMYQIMPYEEQALRLLINSEKGYEDMGAFVDSFSANIIPRQKSIAFLTSSLVEVYKDLARSNTLPKTCLALMMAINTNPDSPIPQNAFHLRTKTRDFYDKYFKPIGSVIRAMKDDSMRVQYVAVYDSELKKFENKMH